jgi:serine/threonine protein phosphatase PrpC
MICNMADITIRRPVKWLSSSATDVGTVRTLNEDAILARPDVGLWVVADGMGGHEAGSIASKLVVDSLAEVGRNRGLNDLVLEIENSILDANRRLLEYSEVMLDGRMLGSTFVCLVVQGQIGVCLWAGDSRLYVSRNKELRQISTDHSYVSELLKQGSITEAEAATHPEANVITRAVGTSSEIHIDIEIFAPQVGDTYLLCTDGLYNAVDKQTLEDRLADKTVDDVVSGLMRCALDGGASDNVSAIVVRGVRCD